MPRVNFTYALKRFYPKLESVDIVAGTVAEVLISLDQQFPGIRDYLVDDQGRLRQHVNIFIGDKLIKDKKHLTDQVSDSDQLFIMQALSGG